MRKTALIVLGVSIALVLGFSIVVFRSGLGSAMSALYFGLGLEPKARFHFQVQVQDAVKDEADLTIGVLYAELQKARIDEAAIDRNDPSTVEQADSIEINLRGVPAARLSDLRSLVSARFPVWTLTPASETGYRMNPTAEELAALKRVAVEQTLVVIRNRVRALGLVGRASRGNAAYEIVVELARSPADPARVREVLTSRARLEITAVMDGPLPGQDQALARHGGVLPFNSRVVQAAPRSGQEQGWFLLASIPVIRGADLRDARPSQDSQTGAWDTDFVLTQDAARRFERFTEANIGNRLAIVLDGKVLGAPVIQTRISDTGRIAGAANEREASDMALLLRTGSLPAGLVAREER